MPNTISHETVHWMKRNALKVYQGYAKKLDGMGKKAS